MGLFGTLVGFGAGYALGMRLGERPADAFRSARTTLQEGGRPTEVVQRSMQSLRARSSGGGTIDLRTIRDVMTAEPVTVQTSSPVAEAARLMESRAIGDVIVTNERQELEGIVTDRDIATRCTAKGLNPDTTPVTEIFTRSTVTLAPDDAVQTAVDLMRRHDVRRLPVLEGNRPIGIVSLGPRRRPGLGLGARRHQRRRARSLEPTRAGSDDLR
jgi:CBS domain-containing protein